jgi:hypothetical protein
MESAFLTTQLGCNLLLDRENSAHVRRLCADRYQRWAFDFWPHHPDLTQSAIAAAQELGGSTLPFPAGRLGTLFAYLVGWKSVRRLQQIACYLGWQYVQALKQR